MSIYQNLKTFVKSSIASIVGATPVRYGNHVRRSVQIGKSVEQDPYIGLVGWSWFAINKVARRVSKINFELYQLKGEDVEMVDDHQILADLHRANATMTKTDLFYIVGVFLMVWGKAPLYLIRNKAGKITGYYPVRPDLLRAKTDKTGTLVGYTFRSLGKETDFPVTDIVNLREPDPTNYNEGKSRFLASALEIDADLASAIWNRYLLENGAEPGGVLHTEQELTDEAYKRLVANWEARHGGPGNAGKTAILEMGLKYEKVSQTQKELDFINSRTFNRDTILTLLGVPISLIDKQANRANADTARRQFEEDTIDPLMDLIVEQFNEFVLPQYEGMSEMWLSYTSPISEDSEVQLNKFDKGINRFLSVNDIREELGLPLMEGGDYIYYPLSSVPMVGEGAPGNVFDAGADEGKAMGNVVRFGRKTSGYMSPKKKDIKGHILAKTHRRRMITKHVTDNVLEKIDAALKTDGKRIVVKGLKLKDSVKDKKDTPKKAEGEDLVEIPDSLKRERKAYLKALPAKERAFKKALKKYFQDQEKIVKDNLENQFKGRNNVLNKGFIEDVLFDKTSQIALLVSITKPLISDNVADGAEGIATLMGVPFEDLTAIPSVINFIETVPLKFSREINETTENALRKTLSEGLDNGESIGEFGDRISAVFQEARGYRTETIARTEVGKSLNFGRYSEMKRQGVEKKVWVAIFSNTRGDHIHAHGQEVKMDESFDVGGELLMYPQDPAGSPGNVINCQCTASPVL